MRKFLLATTLALNAFFANAQDYNFSVLNQSYTPLTDGTTLNNKVWFHEGYGIPLPFNIEIFGQKVKNLVVLDGILFADDFIDDATQYQLFAQTGEIFDAGFVFGNPANNNNLSNSQSPLRFKVDGIVGNRILKIEVSNAANVFEYFYSNSNNMRISYQFWFYEGSQQIEFHYGPNTISDFNVFFHDYSQENQITPNLNVMISKVKYVPNENPAQGEPDELPILQNIISLNGAGNNPTAMTSLNEIGKLNSYPENGKVFQFNKDVLSVNKNLKANIVLYPNPVSDLLYVTLDELDTNLDYQIFDITGKVIQSAKLNDANNIDVAAFNTGIYFLKVANYKTVKFIKK